MMETAAAWDISDTIRQAQNGDAGAFSRIVRRYQSLVSGVLFSATGDFHKSEDLAQETFLVAWNKLDELRDPERLAAWLCAIARNLVRQSQRKPVLMSGETVEEKASNEPGPEVELIRREQSEMVWSAIGRIDEPYRESLVLYYRSGRSVQEIAAATESSEEAVRQRLVRARKSLKVKLEQMIGDVLSDTAPGDIFTYGVMAAIGTSVLAVGAETAVAASVASATGVTTGTGAAGVLGTGSVSGKAAGLAPFWMILGPLAYFAWMFSLLFINAWSVVRNAPTLRSRRSRVRSFITSFQYFFLYVIGVAILVTVISQLIPFHRLQGSFVINPGRLLSFFVPFGTAYLVTYLIVRKNRRRFKQLVETELGLRDDDLANKCDTLQSLRKRLNQAVLTNVLLLETIVGLVLILPVTDGSITLPLILGTLGAGCGFGLVIYVFYRFGQFLLRLCQSESSLLEYPPLVERPFEVALRLGTENPMAFDRLPRNRVPRWIAPWFYLGIVFSLVWYFTLYDWSINPIATAICALSLVVIGAVHTVCVRKTKDKRKLYLYGGLFFLPVLVVVAVLETIECGRFSIPLILHKASMQGPENLVHVPNLLFMILGSLGTVYGFVQYFRYGSDKLNQRENDHLEIVRRAIAAYKPNTVDPESEERTPRFRSRFWGWFCFGYAVLILVLFSVFALFPEEIFGKSYLMKRSIRSGNFTALIKMDPTNPIYYFQRGCRAGNPQKAVDDFDTAIRLNPNYTEAYLNRANAWIQWGFGNTIMMRPVGSSLPEENKARFLMAVADCDTAIRLDPKNDEPWRIRSNAHQFLGDLDTAIEDATKAISLKPVSTNFFQRAVIYDFMDDLQNALTDCTEAIRLQEENNRRYGSDNPEVFRDLNEYVKPYYRFRAGIYEKLGEPDKAQADLLRSK